MGRVESEPDCRADRDAADFAETFDRYLPRLYKYMRYRTGSRDEAEDLTSRVFEQVIANMGRYSPDRAPFDSWIFTIARNILTDYRRWRGRRRDVPIDLAGELAGDGNGPAEELIRKETREELLQALSGLSERERDIIGLKFAAGLSNKEISKMTGLTESNVAVIIFRAVKRLRTVLAAKEVNF